MNTKVLDFMSGIGSKAIAVLEALVAQLPSVVGPLTADVQTAVDAVLKAISDLKAAYEGLETAVKNAINPPPPAA